MAKRRNDLVVRLPGSLRTWVERQTKAADFDDPADFIRHVLATQRARQSELEELLVEGLSGGPSVVMDEREWSRLRDRVRDRIRSKHPRRKSA